MDAATVYFQKHQVPELVDNLLDKVLKSMPNNPQQFIADQLTKHVDNAYPPEYSYPFDISSAGTAANTNIGGQQLPLGKRGSLLRIVEENRQAALKEKSSAAAGGDGGDGNILSGGHDVHSITITSPMGRLTIPEILTLEKYSQMRDTATATGATLEQCIEDCVTDYRGVGENYVAKRVKESQIPAFPLDVECLDVFSPMFELYIKGQHKVKLNLAQANSFDGASPEDLKELAKRNNKAIETASASASMSVSGKGAAGAAEGGTGGPVSEENLTFMYEVDYSTNRVKGGFSLEYAVSAVVRLRRNVKAYRFAAGMSRAERTDLCKQISTRCPRCPTLEGGEFVDFLGTTNSTEDMSMLPVMMQPRISKRCRKAGGEWPHNRGVFVTNDHLLGILVGNLEEHLEIVSVATDGNLRQAFERAYEASGQLESELFAAGRGGFTTHPFLGYLQCNSAFIGSGLTFEITLILPLLAQQPELQDILAKNGLCKLTEDDSPLPTAEQEASDASGDFNDPIAGGLGGGGGRIGGDKDYGTAARSDGSTSDDDKDSRGTDLEGDITKMAASNPLHGSLVLRNAVTLKYNEWQQLQAVVDGCARLVELEQMLESGDSIDGKW